MKLIAIEEHFLTDDVAATFDDVDRALVAPSRVQGLNEIGEVRLRAMDEAGIDLQVLSLNKPGLQGITDAGRAVALATASNDNLAKAVAQHPTRFAGFAALPTTAPEHAARELERAVATHGFKGAMIHGHTAGAYLDDKRFWPIFEAAQALDVPIYLHPSNPHPAVMEAYFKGFPVLGYAPWGYAVETGTHVLRLILSGVFDAYPRLKLIIGHMGELLPFAMWRADIRLTPQYPHLKRSVREYFTQNISVTTSGVFSTPEFMLTANLVGFDNLMFSVDYPFESNLKAKQWFDTLPISAEDRAKVAHQNAQRLLRL